MAVYTVKGQVFHNGVAYVGLKVRLYDRSTKTLLLEQTTTTNGHYTFTGLTYNGPFFVVALGDILDVIVYNAMVWDNVTGIQTG